MISKKITILILTNSDTSPFIDRCIKYHYDLSCNIVIIDSAKKVLDIKISNIKVFNSTKKDIYERLKFGISKIKTKYFLWLGDDDFIIKKTFKKSIKLLKNNKYNMVQGQYIKFFENKFNLEDYNSDYFFYNLKNFKKFQNNKYALENFYYSFKMFNPHAILDKKIFRKAINFFLIYKNFKPFAYFDKIIGIFFLLEGKSLLINDLYQLRSYGTGSWQQKKNLVSNKTDYFYLSNITNLVFELKKNKFLKRLIIKKTSQKTYEKFIYNVKQLAIEERNNHEKQTIIGNILNNFKKKILKFDHTKIINYSRNIKEIMVIKNKVNKCKSN